MAIRLTAARYGKAQTRLVHVDRTGEQHRLTDLNVGIALSGDLDATHLTGDNSAVLPTDTMKNTVYAFAREHGVGEPEAFGLRLARHFVATQPPIHHAQVIVDVYGWQPLGPHSFARDGGLVRSACVTVDADGEFVASGLSGLVLLNTTASEFRGFTRDRYTTLPETTDRMLATAVDARWRGHSGADTFLGVRDALVKAFTATYSASLQQTLLSMGTWVLESRPEVDEIRLTLPNRHHLLVDLSPFELDNPNEVYLPTDRPYGLIEGTVTRDGAEPAGERWWDWPTHER